MAPRVVEGGALTRPGPGALDRDARTPAFLGFDGDPGAVLGAARIVIGGLGSIGQHLADGCARQGVGTLQLVDPARVKPESLLTHPLLPRDVGRTKVAVAAERAALVGPETRVLACEMPFEELPADALVGADAVLLASDNLACEVAVAGRCLALGIPLIQAAVYGRALVAQVRCLQHADPAGACLACAFTRAEWEDLDRGTVFSCAHADGRAPLKTGPPTVSPPQLCALAADLALVELTKALLGLGRVGDAVVEYCGYGPALTRSELRRRAECPLEHVRTRHVRPERPLGTLPLAELVALGGPEVCTLAVEGFAFARYALCACHDHPHLERFVAPGAVPAPCPRCQAPLHPHPFATDREVALTRLASHLDRTLFELGANDAPSVTLRGASVTVLVSNSPPLTVAPDTPDTPDPEGGKA